MKRTVRPCIVVCGAGIAGSLITSGLAHRGDIDLACLERVGADEHMDAGTGLNLGPNAMKALRAIMPERAEAIVADSLPWERWSIALTDGQVLMDLALSEVSDNPGTRIRWAELYALLRAPIADKIIYGAELQDCGRDENGLFVGYVDRSDIGRKRLDSIDLLIGGDGRYSQVRDRFFGVEAPNFLGVCLFRLLFPVAADCPIDDYGQWFNGSNRLLAFRVPGDFVYCAGSFPLPADGEIPDAMRRPAALSASYMPANGRPSLQAKYLMEAIERHGVEIHWARLQDGTVRYAGEPGVMLVGDSAHPMVPTLGQGATQAMEDACVAVDEVGRALDAGDPLEVVPERVEKRRLDRVRFVVEFSREASDTMLAGADPIVGSLKKREPEFRDRLARLYRDAPAPRA
jgi:2-polyprenyl-6-methoxyphenol hydroxylase-like FAD-dependent oxidoreductase